MRAWPIISLLCIVLGGGFFHLPTARAEGTQDAHWGIVPVPDTNPAITATGYFIYPMQPGASVTGAVLLRNPGATSVTIDLTSVDAETAQHGGSAFTIESGSANGVAGWVTLSQRQAILAPGGEQLVPFSFHAPDDVQPGQYLTGISASEAPVAAVPDPATKSGLGASITMHTRYVIAVQADVAGTWTSSLSVSKVSVLDQPSGTVIGVQLRNDGGTFLKPSGRVVVTDAAGHRLLSHEIEMGTFVPGTEVTYPIAWPDKPVAGSYTVAVQLSYAEGKTTTSENTITVSSETERHAVEQANSVAAPQNAAQPAINLAPAIAPGIQPWMLYMIGLLLLMIVLLLVLNLRRGRSKKPHVQS